VNKTLEFWLKVYVRYLQSTWTAYKLKNKSGGSTKDTFVQQLDPSVRLYLQYVVKTMISNDCWISLAKLCEPLTAIKKEFPSLASALLNSLITLSTSKVTDQEGIQLNDLSLQQTRALCSGKLYARYLMERTVGQMDSVRKDHGVDSTSRIVRIDTSCRILTSTLIKKQS